MCYVIENFQTNLQTLKWYVRIKALFFLRNVNRFFNLLSALCYNYSTQHVLHPQFLFRIKFVRYFFTKMFFIIPNTVSTRFKVPFVLNIFKSFQYWSLQKLLLMFPQPQHNPQALGHQGPYLVNLPYNYYLTRKVTPLRLNKQPYKLVMVVLIRFFLEWWPQFNVYRKAPHVFTTITNQYLFLKYYNSYFFKIYSF
jgi:hypothetical protein